MCIYVCLCVYLLYPFICWWTLRIASISWLLSTALVWTLGCIYLFKFVWVFFFFWYIYSGVEWLDHLVVSFFQESPYCFPLWQQLFTFPPTVWRVAFYSHPHQCLWFVIFLIIAFLTGIRWYFIMLSPGQHEGGFLLLGGAHWASSWGWENRPPPLGGPGKKQAHSRAIVPAWGQEGHGEVGLGSRLCAPCGPGGQSWGHLLPRPIWQCTLRGVPPTLVLCQDRWAAVRRRR